MYFYWNHKSADIGYHTMVVKQNNGENLPTTEVSLWDYSGDYHRELYKNDTRMKNVAFRWTWCSGWSYSQDHLYSENLTLKDVQNEIELWTLQQFIKGYEQALADVERRKPFAEWAESRIKDKKYQTRKENT